MKITVAIGADHRGFTVKSFLMSHTVIGRYSIEWLDVGTYASERTDYPIFAQKVALLMQQKQVDYGIVACGTGIGMAIAANRFKGVYAGLVWNNMIARLAKEDDNVNLLVLPADFISQSEALDLVKTWLEAKFKEGRYAERIAMIDAF